MDRRMFIACSLGALALASSVARPSLLRASCRRVIWGATPGACGDARRRRTFQSGYTLAHGLTGRFSR